MRWLGSIINSLDINLGKLLEIVEDRRLVGYSPWGRKGSDTT